MKKHLISALVVASILAACGGGGDSETTTTPTPQASAAGYWADSQRAMVVTGSGEVWGIGLTSPSYTLFTGTMTSAGSNFSATLKAYSGTSSISGTLAGTFVEKKTLSGTAASAAGSGPFSMTYDSTFETAPSLSRVAGTYSVSSGGAVVISSTGALSGSSGGCAITGTVTPGTDGGNYYRVSVTFGAAPCAIPNGTANGVVGQSGSRLAGGLVSGNLGDAFVLTKI